MANVLTAAEIKELLAKSEGLALVRGRWVEVDRERLQRMIDRFREIEQTRRTETGSSSAKRCGCSRARMSRQMTKIWPQARTGRRWSPARGSLRP